MSAPYSHTVEIQKVLIAAYYQMDTEFTAYEFAKAVRLYGGYGKKRLTNHTMHFLEKVATRTDVYRWKKKHHDIGNTHETASSLKSNDFTTAKIPFDTAKASDQIAAFVDGQFALILTGGQYADVASAAWRATRRTGNYYRVALHSDDTGAVIVSLIT